MLAKLLTNLPNMNDRSWDRSLEREKKINAIKMNDSISLNNPLRLSQIEKKNRFAQCVNVNNMGEWREWVCSNWSNMWRNSWGKCCMHICRLSKHIYRLAYCLCPIPLNQKGLFNAFRFMEIYITIENGPKATTFWCNDLWLDAFASGHRLAAIFSLRFKKKRYIYPHII